MKRHFKNTDCLLKNGAEFRFYEALNDFLLPEQRKQTLNFRFSGNPGIKDPIEVFGVPHTEVGLIVVNGASVGFDYQLADGDRVAVYPAFKGIDISPLVKLREPLQRPAVFVIDLNLGKLARLMRLFGFDALFAKDLSDKEIAHISMEQKRIVLTRDRRLLYAKAITYGYWVRAVKPLKQLAEVVERFDLADQLRPFCRCTVCNSLIDPVEKREVLQLLEPKTRLYYDRFYRCPDCGKVYWEGSHVDHIRERFARYLGMAGMPDTEE